MKVKGRYGKTWAKKHDKRKQKTSFRMAMKRAILAAQAAQAQQEEVPAVAEASVTAPE
jgi:hypothetical protein